MTDRKRAPLAAAAAACAGILYLALAVGQTASAVTADVSVSFLSTGGEQTFVVPAGVTQISVVANGGKGGNGGGATNNGGFGAVVSADVPVSPGQTLFVEVAGNGEAATSGFGADGGFNGGRQGGDSGETTNGEGGGGSGGESDIRTVSRVANPTNSLNSRLVIAGGGGGGGGGVGGGAGGAAGNDGSIGSGAGGGSGGTRATPTAPGGSGSQAGELGIGGLGETSGMSPNGAGGAGGGGAFGGGGGLTGAGGSSNGGGGGGGSSAFAPAALDTAAGTSSSGTPLVKITYTPGSTGGGGTGGGGSTGGGTAPKVSSLKTSPRTFVAAGSGGSIAAATGTTISYSDSLAGKTTFKVLRPMRGVRVHGHCLAPRRSRHGSRCTRYVSVGSFSHIDTAGANSFHFTGRVRRHTLRPGSYKLSATPVANGTKGTTRTTRFSVVR